MSETPKSRGGNSADRGAAFGPEAVTAMALAFDKASDALGVRDQADPELIRSVAAKVFDLARGGERDVDRLCALTVRALSKTQTYKTQT